MRPKREIRLGESLRAYRIRKHMTQQELADKAGLGHKSWVSRIETGSWKTRLETLVSLAAALNISLDRLVFGPRAWSEPGQWEARADGTRSASGS